MSLVEIVPVIGPLIGAIFVLAVGLPQSLHVALMALLVVVVVRTFQSYVINPHLMGNKAGLSPLVTLVTVSVVGVLFGAFAVILAIPVTSAVQTLIDVFVLDHDPPAEESRSRRQGSRRSATVQSIVILRRLTRLFRSRDTHPWRTAAEATMSPAERAFVEESAEDGMQTRSPARPSAAAIRTASWVSPMNATATESQMRRSTQRVSDLADSRAAPGAKSGAHASARRRHPGQALSDRDRRVDRGQLRGLALLRASPPQLVDLPRVVLSLLRERLVPCPGAVGGELGHGHVPARELGPHPRQHAVPRDLRQERRGCLRGAPLPALLLRRRLRRDADPDGDDPPRRHRRRQPRPQPRGERRDRGGARRLLRPLPEGEGDRAARDLPGQDLGLVLPRRLVPLPAGRGELRPLLGRSERRRRRLLRSRRRLHLRCRRDDSARQLGPA